MSQRRKRLRREQRRSAFRRRCGTPACDALDDLSDLYRVVMDGGLAGGPVLLIFPRAEWTEPDRPHEDFDRAVCLAGVKEFIRPRLPSDTCGLPDVGVLGQWMFVREIRPGVRLRTDVTLALPRETLGAAESN